MQGPDGLQAIQTNRQAPGGVSQVGAPLPQGLAPTQKLPYVQAQAAASASGSGLAQGSVGDVNAHYQAVQAEAQKAEMFTGIARNVQEFAHTAITGTPAVSYTHLDVYKRQWYG